MFKPLFYSFTCTISLLGFSILPSFAKLESDFGPFFSHSPNTITIALNSTEFIKLKNNHYDLVQFQVEFLLSPKCHGNVPGNGELESRDVANNCLWDDSSLGKKTAKPDIYAILVEGNQPFPKRSDCEDTPSARCILKCPENQYRCQFTLLLNSQKTYSLFLADKDLLVDDNAGVFVFSPPPQLNSQSKTLIDKDGRSVVKLTSNVSDEPIDACFWAIEILADDPNSASFKVQMAKNFLESIDKNKKGFLPDFGSVLWTLGGCKDYFEQIKPQTY